MAEPNYAILFTRECSWLNCSLFFSFRTRLWRCVRGVGNNLGRETLHLRTFCSFYRPRFASVLQVRKSLNYWGFTYVSSLNFKTSRLAFRGGSCYYQYFTIVFALFSVAVTVSTHLYVVCHHFCCPMSLFQSRVSCGIHFSISNSLV